MYCIVHPSLDTRQRLSLMLYIQPKFRLSLHLIPLLSLLSWVFRSGRFNIVQHGGVGPFDSFCCPVEIAVLKVSERARSVSKPQRETVVIKAVTG